MAIVFISPKEKQKVFILGITGLFFLILILIGLRVFLAKPKRVIMVDQFFNAPKIEINFDILDLSVIKNLDPLPGIKKEFNYTAQTSKGAARSGVITAFSQEEATQVLMALGLSNVVLKEIEGGRDNPFAPYYGVEPSI